ncbi:uncharacterized protein FIESC28_00189 [Fusarium coffeatum]|uniref:CBM-cenC domain-containing protein n=1 Tax=Fusarium coffeatum TaxID=231269 RepID=A0A366SC72_9HYPO|nr:uncharacterized protein FIESC28_00189 [Fusarium coffeatum]RBR26921.1 hypothetical protein FIESC28_00189 [Fusarium coffeatum]
MRVPSLNLVSAFLAVCGNAHASPCKPKSTSAALDGPSSTGTVTSVSTQEATSASYVVSITTEGSSVIESLSFYSSSIISKPVSFIVTTTSDAFLSYSTELSSSSETTEASGIMAADMSATTASTTELSTELPTTSNTAETTTSDIPISTTSEEPAPSNLFFDPSFEEPSIDGEVDGTPWIVRDGPSSSVGITPDVARTGSHAAYWSVTVTGQNGGTVKQEVALDYSHFYKISYWWYIDEDAQPESLRSCYISIVQDSTDGKSSSFPDFFLLPSPLPLKTWTKRELSFNSINITPAYMTFSVFCFEDAGTGLKVAIDDIQLVY